MNSFNDHSQYCKLLSDKDEEHIMGCCGTLIISNNKNSQVNHFCVSFSSNFDFLLKEDYFSLTVENIP